MKKDTNSRASSIGCFFWGAAFVLTATVSATVGASLALLSPLSPVLVPLQKNRQQENGSRYGSNYHLARPVNILVIGIDRVSKVPENSPEVFTGRSDTMLLVRLDPTPSSSPTPSPIEEGAESVKGVVKILFIPRDTLVQVLGAGMAKINRANVDGGAALAARVVSRNLNNVPIDRYIRVTPSAVRELIDLIGGVEVFVPQRMHYADTPQNLKIDLEQGWQTLNGDRAEQFIRFCNDQSGDIGRVQRQQALFKALRQRLASPSVLPRLPQIMQIMWKYVDTNLSLAETLTLVNFVLSVDKNDANMVILPGRFSLPKEYPVSYWIIDPTARDRVMREYFQRDLVKGASGRGLALTGLRIAIQNATGQPQAGHRVAKYLASQGFKKVYLVANWPDLQRQTQIIVQQGDLNAANNLKKVLGLGNIEADSTGDIDSDLTIQLGADWTDGEF